MRGLRKIAALASAVMLALGTAGCKGGENAPVLNANRGTDYEYDFINYINVSLFGNDGEGFIEVEPKDIKASDFESEDDYIALKKLFDEIDLTYKPASGDSEEVVSENFTVSPVSGLSNGDIITFTISSEIVNETGVSVNLEPYQYQISELGTQTELDLFDDSNVVFYGLEGSQDVYPAILESGKIPEELRENIVYDISTDGAGELEVDKTILTISASLSQEFLSESDVEYRNLAEYLMKHGYQGVTEKEKVLQTIASPTDFNSISNKKNLASSLNKALQAEVSDSEKITSLVNIQQPNGAIGDPEEATTDRYTYYVLFNTRDEDTGETRLRAAQVRMVEVAEEMQILSVSSVSEAQEQYATEPLSNYTIVYQFEATALEDLEDLMATPEPTMEPPVDLMGDEDGESDGENTENPDSSVFPEAQSTENSEATAETSEQTETPAE